MHVALSLVTAALSTATVEGTVLQRESHWEHGLIVTDTTLRVERVVGGEAPTEVKVRHLGGTVNGVAQVVFGEPELPARSGRVRVSLERSATATTWRLAASDSNDIAHADDAGGAHTAVRATTAINEGCEGEAKPLHWPTSQVDYVVDSRLPDGLEMAPVEAAVDAAFAAWSAVDCSYLGIGYEGQDDDPLVGYSANGNTNVVTWIEHDWPGKSSTQAITALTFMCADGVVLDADIIVNAEDFDFTTDGGARHGDGERQRDLQNVLTHEAGHFVGFAHSPDPDSTMYAWVYKGETAKRDLTVGDVAGMCEAYPVGHEPDAAQSPLGCQMAVARPDDNGKRQAFLLLGVLAIGLGWLAFARRAQRKKDESEE
jgi:hypothetical protein